MKTPSALLLLASFTLTACGGSQNPSYGNLHATLWTQTSAEFQALTWQTYMTAMTNLDEAIEDASWTAAPEQTSAPDLPPAIILDLDETVLDNSPYQARLIEEGATYETESWNAWCNEGNAEAIPGAVEFITAAEEMGVTVFYVSNRSHEVEEATRANLEAIGLTLPEDEDTVLLKYEQEDWGSDKGTRRLVVAANYRIIMLFGDNLGDFLDGYKTSLETRDSMVTGNAANWGTRWYVLPNPQYGSWESALFGHDYGIELEDREEMKEDALDTRD